MLGVAVSTAAVFGAWDGIDRGPLGKGPLLERAIVGRNDLEAPACAIAPEIARVRALLDAAPGVLLALVLGSFFAGGHGWTRPVLVATALVGVLVGAVCLDNDLPTIFVVLSAVLIVESLVLVFFLWRRDTTAHLRD